MATRRRSRSARSLDGGVMAEHVKTDIADGVMTLTLGRLEKKKTLTGAMYDALSNALKRVEADPSIRVVLFQSDRDSFTAGNDLADFAMPSLAHAGAVDSPVHRFIETINKASKPLVAPVQGEAVGVGAIMLQRCVHLAENAQLSLVPEA